MDSSLHLPARAQAYTRRDAIRLFGLAAFSSGFAARRAIAADDKKTNSAAASEAPPISSVPLVGKISLVTGAGGNIVVFGGTDGTVVIDSGLASVAAGTGAEIGRLSPGPVEVLINTHWHFDHAGGNERLGSAGARIIAHERCRDRLSSEQYMEFFDRKMPASPKVALPVLTFTSETTLHLNEETIRLIPVAPAHTDGDVLVRFDNANVLHMGDTFFNGAYPFIDYSSKGWIGGMVEAAKAGIGLCDATTQIVPGHGPVATIEDLKRYLAFLETALDRFSKAKAAGKTADQVAAENPVKEFDAKLGNGFLKPEQFVRAAYTSLLKHS